MRIPNEALPTYVSDNERKPNGEGQRAEPVDNASRLGDAMSQSRAKQGKNQEKSGDHRELELNHRRQAQASEERREHDRRKAKQPVLLDTRQAHGRRTSADYPKIDFKV